MLGFVPTTSCREVEWITRDVERIILDRSTGILISNVRSSARRESFVDRLTGELAHELHYGTFGGLPTRILYLCACLVVDLLYATGIAMWIIKRPKRRLGRAGGP